MRTTVDLPDATHRRVVELARSRGTSVSATIAELTTRGLSEMGQPAEISVDPDSGFPVLSLGRRVTNDEVLEFLDEE